MTDVNPNPTPPVSNQTAGLPLTSKVESEKDEDNEVNPDESRWVRDANDDNALDPGNDAFVGVSPEYENWADSTLEPLKSDDPELRKVEEEAAKRAESLKVPVQVTNPALPYEPDTPHPSEAKKPVDKFIDANRAILERMAEGK